MLTVLHAVRLELARLLLRDPTTAAAAGEARDLLQGLWDAIESEGGTHPLAPKRGDVASDLSAAALAVGDLTEAARWLDVADAAGPLDCALWWLRRGRLEYALGYAGALPKVRDDVPRCGYSRSKGLRINTLLCQGPWRIDGVRHQLSQGRASQQRAGGGLHLARHRLSGRVPGNWAGGGEVHMGKHS